MSDTPDCRLPEGMPDGNPTMTALSSAMEDRLGHMAGLWMRQVMDMPPDARIAMARELLASTGFMVVEIPRVRGPGSTWRDAKPAEMTGYAAMLEVETLRSDNAPLRCDPD